MTARRSVWLSSSNGPIFVDPAHVVAVSPAMYDRSVVHMVNGHRFELDDERSTEEIARILLGPSDLDPGA